MGSRVCDPSEIIFSSETLEKKKRVDEYAKIQKSLRKSISSAIDDRVRSEEDIFSKKKEPPTKNLLKPIHRAASTVTSGAYTAPLDDDPVRNRSPLIRSVSELQPPLNFRTGNSNRLPGFNTTSGYHQVLHKKGESLNRSIHGSDIRFRQFDAEQPQLGSGVAYSPYVAYPRPSTPRISFSTEDPEEQQRPIMSEESREHSSSYTTPFGPEIIQPSSQQALDASKYYQTDNSFDKYLAPQYQQTEPQSSSQSSRNSTTSGVPSPTGHGVNETENVQDDEKMIHENSNESFEDEARKESVEGSVQELTGLFPFAITLRDIKMQEILLSSMKYAYQMQTGKNVEGEWKLPDHYFEGSHGKRENFPNCGFYLPESVIWTIESTAERRPNEFEWVVIIKETLLYVYGNNISNYCALGQSDSPAINRQLYHGLYSWAASKANGQFDIQAFNRIVNKYTGNKRRYTNRTSHADKSKGTTPKNTKIVKSGIITDQNANKCNEYDITNNSFHPRMIRTPDETLEHYVQPTYTHL